MEAGAKGSQPELMVQTVRNEVRRGAAESRRRCLRDARESKALACQNRTDSLSEVVDSGGIWPCSHGVAFHLCLSREAVRVARQVLRQNAQLDIGR